MLGQLHGCSGAASGSFIFFLMSDAFSDLVMIPFVDGIIGHDTFCRLHHHIFLNRTHFLLCAGWSVGV